MSTTTPRPVRVTDANAAQLCRALGRYLERTLGDDWAEHLNDAARQLRAAETGTHA